MKQVMQPAQRPWLAAAFAAIGAALLGAGLAGWLEQGTRLFISLAETGLAWCF